MLWFSLASTDRPIYLKLLVNSSKQWIRNAYVVKIQFQIELFLSNVKTYHKEIYSNYASFSD